VSATLEPAKLAKGFKTIYKPKKGGLRFGELLARVAEIDPNLRVRFTSPHPKDFPDEVTELTRVSFALCTLFRSFLSHDKPLFHSCESN
jgi:hypothetical protein